MNRTIKLLTITALTLVGFTSLPLSALADSSPSDIQAQVKSLEQEIASKAASLKGEVSQKLNNKIAEGTVSSLTSSQIVLSPIDNYSDDPHNQTVLINSFTTYSFANRKLTKTINKDDYIVALGDVDDTGNLAAQEIIKAPEPTVSLPDSVMGKVVSITGSTLTVEGQKNQTTMIATTVGTSLYSGDNEITFSQIKMGEMVIATGQTVKGNVFNARFVYLVPSEVVSPTAKPSASSSASPASKSK